MDSVITLRNRGNCEDLLIIAETAVCEVRVEPTELELKNAKRVNILINNVVLSIKINLSLLSLQSNRFHMAKYLKIPEAWRCKFNAYGFMEWVGFTILKGFVAELQETSFNSLTIDESTHISTY
jgi:hypothetical protein